MPAAKGSARTPLGPIMPSILATMSAPLAHTLGPTGVLGKNTDSRAQKLLHLKNILLCSVHLKIVSVLNENQFDSFHN